MNLNEMKHEVKTYKTVRLCGRKTCMGEMKPTGVKYLVSPPEYEHICSICKHTQAFDRIYPVITYE